MLPLSELPLPHLQAVRLVATDMDGTITCQEQITPAILEAFKKLRDSGIQVLITTGRSAGWVSGLAHYLPIWGAIAENGGLLYHQGQEICLMPIADMVAHRCRLAQCFETLKTAIPRLQESSDNRFRQTDWTFDVEGLAIAELDQLASLCQQQGWGFTYSTIQCHIKLAEQEKAVGLQRVLSQFFPQVSRDQLVTIGDSPNDESLFNPELFPLSVGVANLAKYSDRLKYTPAYLCDRSEGQGWLELSQRLLA